MTSSTRRFLVLIRAGVNSLHPKFTALLEEQNFDYALSWYGDEDPCKLGLADGVAFVHHVKGQKWPGLLATLTECAEQIAEYDYVWFPDDDLACEADTVSEFFRVMEDLGLDLAQPALTHQSEYHHPIVLKHENFQLRWTNFVELMAPAMSRTMLGRALPTMAGTLSGWGIDAVWPRLTRVGKVAIVDSTCVTHTRPILGGDGYRSNQEQQIPMMLEEAIAFERYSVRRADRTHLNLAGLLESGETVCLGGIDAVSVEGMMGALASSVAASGIVSFTGFASYLGGHAAFVESEDHRLLPEVLNEALAGTGLIFNGGSR